MKNATLTHRTPLTARQAALQAVIGEPGISAFFIVVIATGLGLLLDFQVANLHPIFSIGLILLSIPASHYWAVRRTLALERKPSHSEYARNIALAAVAGQSGCGTVVLIFMALFAGLFLDARLNTHPLFTIGLVLISVPISLYLMVRMVLSATSMITMPPPPAPGSKLRGRAGTAIPSQSGDSDPSRSTTKENGP